LVWNGKRWRRRKEGAAAEEEEQMEQVQEICEHEH
jgi:hypothetical protein